MQPNDNLDISRALTALRRRWKAIAAVFVIATAVGFGYSVQQAKKYRTTSSVLFGENPVSQLIAGVQTGAAAPATATATATAAATAEQATITSGDAAALTASALGDGLTAARVAAMVTVLASVDEPSVSTITATSTSPAFAAQVANTYAQQFVTSQNAMGSSNEHRALQLLTKEFDALPAGQRTTPAALNIQAGAQELGVLGALPSGGVSVLQTAPTPQTPYAPSVPRDTLIGAVLGLFLGVALAFALESLDYVVRDEREFEEIYGLTVLGSIPDSQELARFDRADPDQKPGIPLLVADAFHLVQAHLRYFNVDTDLRIVLVTSAAPGDGKTTISAHLAAASARIGARVLLIEADLRRPTLSKSLGIRSESGLAEVLIGEATIERNIERVSVGLPLGRDGAPGPQIDVLLAGTTTPPNPVGLMESAAMGAVLEGARERYDLVIVDTPPVTVVSDALALIKHVDGVIVIGRAGKDDRRAARRAIASLRGASAPLLGIVVNSAGQSSPYYDGYAATYAPQ